MQHYTLTIVEKDGAELELPAPHGSNLRELLLENGLSPYAKFTQSLNCGGRGLCATCGVWIEEGEPTPVHWHDRAAKKFSYPRLSCQVRIENDMTIRWVEKWVWGSRRKQ